MAKYPIYEAQGTLPGQSPNRTRSYNTDTGGAAVGQAMQRFGGELFELGSTIHRMQGETELAEAMADSNDAIQQMHVRLAGNTDETTYQQDFDETWSEVSGRELKNGWARREFSLRLPQIRSNQQAIVDMAKAQRIEKNWNTQEANLAAQAETTGNVGIYESFLGSALRDKRITQDEFDLKVGHVRRMAQRQQLESIANNDPDTILDRYKTWDDMHKDFPDAQPSEFAYIRNLATAQKAFLESQKEELWDEIVNDTLGKAWSMDLDEFRAQVRQTVGIDEKQKSHLLKLFIDAQQDRQSTGKSPFAVTQNEMSLANAYLAIDNGDITSVQNVNDLYLEGEKVNWSTSDMLAVKRYLRSQQDPSPLDKYSRTHPAIVPFLDMYRAGFRKDIKVVNGRAVFKSTEAATRYAKGLVQLETGWMEPGVIKDVAKIRQKYEDVAKIAKDIEARGWLENAVYGLNLLGNPAAARLSRVTERAGALPELAPEDVAPPAADKIQMRAPDGAVVEFDKEYADEARRHGYEDLQ